jgi:hypothetical protein
MSKLPAVIFVFTLLAIAGVTFYHFQTVQAVAPQVAAARQQIKQTAAEPEILPQVTPRTVATAERLRLRTEAPIETVPTETIKTALAAQKANNRTLVQAANVLATAAQPTSAAPESNLKLYVQLGLTIVFIPFCLYFILSAKFNATQKNFAYTTIGTILGFWFATGA